GAAGIPLFGLVWTDSRIGTIRAALDTGDVEGAQAEIDALLASPAAAMLPLTDNGRAILGTVLDTPRVETLMTFSEPVLWSDQAQSKRGGAFEVDGVAFFFYRDQAKARLVRCLGS